MTFYLCFTLFLTFLVCFISYLAYFDILSIVKFGLYSFVLSFFVSYGAIYLASNDMNNLIIENTYIRSFDIYKTRSEIKEKFYGIPEENDKDQDAYFYFVKDGKTMREPIAYYNLTNKSLILQNMKYFEIKLECGRKYSYFLDIKKVILQKRIGLESREVN